MLFLWQVITLNLKLNNMKYFRTKQTATTEDYPYGRLRCTATFGTEWDKKKGYRSVFQTINPKTGRVNAPKKSTYTDIMVMYQKEDGFIGHTVFSFYDEKSNERAFTFLNENFDLFEPEEMEYIYMKLLSHLKITAQARVMFCGADADKVVAVMDECVQLVVIGIKSKGTGNIFPKLKIPYTELEALENPEYKPFAHG